MKHPNEVELIAFREGEVVQHAELAGHIKACDKCQAELERIESVLRALDNLPVPDPGPDYGRKVWQQIAPRLSEKRQRWWQIWIEPQRLAAVGGIAALVVIAFLVGRGTQKHDDSIANAALVRERVLVVAVGEHLGRSEMMLVELSNAEPKNSAQKEVNISAEQRRAEDLLEENRLYRQSAMREGDAGLASVLDELERTLLDVAHSPDQVTPAQLENIRKKIETQGILFKVRVAGRELQQRQKAEKPSPAVNDSTRKEGNKV